MFEEKNEFGVYNIKTKELFRLPSFKEALFGYMDLIREEISSGVNGVLIPEDWYIVFIQGDEIVQLEQLKYDVKSQKIPLKN